MRFINKTGNTVYLEDIDLNVPFVDEESQQLECDDAKKSSSFRRMVRLGHFVITETDDSLFERNLVKSQSKLQKLMTDREQETEEEIAEPSGNMEVKIRGHIYDAGGYAKVNRNLAIGLARNGVKVQIDPVSKKINDMNEMELRQYGPLLNPVSKDAIAIDSMVPTFGSQGFGRYRRIVGVARWLPDMNPPGNR